MGEESKYIDIVDEVPEASYINMHSDQARAILKIVH